MDGIVSVYKEKGYTSHDVVAKARKILGQKRIGHTGTLDPDAEGVLPLCIGRATKVVPYLTDANKCYEAEVILGAYTTTEDATGEVVETFNVCVTPKQIEEVVSSFVGEYTQTPPMYSAVKINGVRLYELARQGLVVDRPSRVVTIYNCEIIEPLVNNKFKIRVECSKGTYIRTLCTDIGKTLGCGAHMGHLLRTRVGKYTLENSFSLEDIIRGDWELTCIESVFENFAQAVVKDYANSLLYNGNQISADDVLVVPSSGEMVRMYDSSNKFIGIYKRVGSKFVVEKMFL